MNTQYSANYNHSEQAIKNHGSNLDKLWRIFPIIMLLAAFLPIILKALNEFRFDRSLNNSIGDSFSFNSLASTYFGQIGPDLFALLPAALISLGIWVCSRALGAKRYGAAIASCLYIAATIIGIAPNFATNIENGIFAGLMILSAAHAMHAIRQKSQARMAFAFIFSVLASLIHPFTAIPQIAVFCSIFFATRYFEERPIYGLICALCWGPGLYLANWYANYQGVITPPTNELLGQSIGKPNLINQFNPESAKNSFLEFGYFMLNSMPILILAIFAILSFVILGIHFAKNTAKGSGSFIIGFAIFLIISAIGALIYGDISSARWLLDGLLLSIIAALSGINIKSGININNGNEFKMPNLGKIKIFKNKQ
jgi:hypothetical protein